MERRHFVGWAAGALALGAGPGFGPAAGRPGALARSAARQTGAAAWTAARRFADTELGRIAYVERGRGKVALFLHGFPLNGFQWRGAFDRLADVRRCVAPDLLGLGYTEAAPGFTGSPSVQVDMLVAFLDRLSISTVDLVANDSGGLVAQLLMTRHAERVRTVLLTNCDAEPDSPPPAVLPLIELAKAGVYVDRWLVPWLADKALARSEKGLGGMTYTYRLHPTDEAIDYYLEPLVRSEERKAQVHAFAIGLAPNPLAGVEPALARSQVPTRIVWGTGDDIFSKESPGYLDRTLGGSRGVRWVPDAKLFWPEEFPEIVAEEARSLWK